MLEVEQEPTAEPTSTPEPEEVDETPVASDEAEVTEQAVEEEQIETETEEAPAADFYVETVELNHTYAFIDSAGRVVEIVFTALTEAGSLSINEVALSEEQQAALGSSVAYEITSSMENGSFTYDLKLPVEEEVANEDLVVKYAETGDQVAEGEELTVSEKEPTAVWLRGLDHFTVFVVTKNAAAECPGNVYAAGVCYATIQAAVNAVDPNDGIDTVEVHAGTYNENVVINRPVILQGPNASINPNTDSRSPEAIIQGQVSVYASDVSIDGFTITNPSHNGATIKGVYAYSVGSTISNILIQNNIFESIHNANTKGSYGVMIQAEVDVATIADNLFNDISSQGWTHAIEVTPSAGSSVVPKNISITGNTITNISNAAHNDEYAFSVDWASSTGVIADASEITFTDNKILSGDVRNLDSSHRLNAQNNDWGVFSYQEIEDRVNHNCDGWKSFSGLSGLSCSGEDNSLLGQVDYLNPIGGVKSISFTTVDAQMVGGSASTIQLEVDAKYLPYEVERVRFRYAPPGETCKQQYTSPYFNDLGDGSKNGDLYSVSWDMTGLSSGSYTACALMHRNSGAGSEGFKTANLASITVIVDNDDPTAPTIESPTPEQNFTTTPILNQWTAATDTGSGVAKYQIAYLYDDLHTFGGSTCPGEVIDGQAVSGCRDVAGLSRNHVPNSSEQGGVTIWVRAIDTVGNVGDWSNPVHYFYDSIAPTTPTIGGFINPSLACGSITDLHNITVDWSDSTDSGSGLKGYDYQIEYPLANGSGTGIWNAFFTTSQYGGSLNEGTHTIKVRAKDNAGLTSEWSNLCSITADWTAPDVEITNPLDGQYIDGTVAIQGTVIDENLSHYWLNISGPGFSGGPGVVHTSEITSPTTLFNWDTTGLADGEYTIKFEARDLANNKDSGSVHWITVKIDRTAPAIPTLDTPEDGFRVQGVSFNQTWNAVADAVEYEYHSCNTDPGDAGSTCASPKYQNTYTGTTKHVGAGQPNSHFWWQVRAKDAAGNWSDWSESRELIIDNDQPITEWDDLVSPYVATSSPTFTGTSTDQYLAGIASVDYKVENASDSSEVLGWTAATPSDGTFADIIEAFSATPSLADGEYTLSARATDRAGNVESTDYLSVIIDTTTPVSTISSPVNGDVFSDTVSIEGNTSDVHGVSTVELSYAEYDESTGCGAYTAIDTIIADESDSYDWDYDWTPSVEGKYCVKAAGIDVAGNQEHSAVVENVIFDKTIPEITLSIDPIDADGDRGWYITEPTITLTANDSFGVKAIEYQWNDNADGGWTSVAGTQVVLTPPSEAGHVLYYRAQDQGDQYSETGVKVINFDQTDPDAVADMTLGVSGNTVEVEWEAASDNTGIYNYEIIWTNSELDISRSASVPADARSYTITDLESGSWRVRVRAVDNPGLTTDSAQTASVGEGVVAGVTTAITNELESLGIGGTLFGVNAQDTGETTDEDAQNSEETVTSENQAGEVAGVTDDTCVDWQFYWPVILLLGFAAIAIIFEMVALQLGMARHLVTLGLAIGTIILFYLTRNPDCYQGHALAQLDQWFWFVSTATAGLIVLASRFLISDEA